MLDKDDETLIIRAWWVALGSVAGAPAIFCSSQAERTFDRRSDGFWAV